MPDICIRGLVVMIIATWCLPTGAQPNNWTSPSSGRWEDSTWSLGVPPTTNHWIMITNAPSKAVAIFPDTPINFPSTMTVSNLTVSSPTGYVNTFLLNYSGTSHPLRVLNDVNVLDGGVINNQYGALKVDGSMLVMNGSVLMEGALLIVTNRPSSFALDVLSSSLFQTGGVIQACLQLVNSDYSLNNGVLRGSLEIGWLGSGHSYCSQTGGTNFADVRINNGDYRLTNGACVGKIRGFDGSFIQVNSEVNGSVDVDGPPSSRYFRYFMYSGTNHLDKIQIANSWFYQAAGVNILTNDLSVLGFFDDYGPVAFGSYSLDSGIFFCSSIYVGLFGDFYQSNGTNTVTKSVFINPGGGFTLAGGTLQTSNTVIQNHYHHGSEITVGTRFGQSSGAHIVADTLSVSGDYLLSGGILSAKDILLRISSAFEIIGTDLGPLITNTG
ncbi:MAG TPA: hypothetical protein VJQ25_13985, partial [Nitrospira sp.]|nr:hypothetical protein [Nitrospira sp.]